MGPYFVHGTYLVYIGVPVGVAMLGVYRKALGVQFVKSFSIQRQCENQAVSQTTQPSNHKAIVVLKVKRL